MRAVKLRLSCRIIILHFDETIKNDIDLVRHRSKCVITIFFFILNFHNGRRFVYTFIRNQKNNVGTYKAASPNFQTKGHLLYKKKKTIINHPDNCVFGTYERAKYLFFCFYSCWKLLLCSYTCRVYLFVVNVYLIKTDRG